MSDVTMPASELARVMNDINGIAGALEVGPVGWGTLYHLVPRVMEIVETVEGVNGLQKKDLCISLFDALLDKLDLPGPDFIIKPVIKAGLPWVIDLVANATNGEYAINKPAPTIATGDITVPVKPPASETPDNVK